MKEYAKLIDTQTLDNGRVVTRRKEQVVITWTKVKDALPTEYGTYLVVRGHWYMGVMNYEIATTNFQPKGGHWFDRGFVYTHWIGPISKPDMPLGEFPILLKEAPAEAA
jgi:hypothetical protein